MALNKSQPSLMIFEALPEELPELAVFEVEGAAEVLPPAAGAAKSSNKEFEFI